MIQKRTTNQSGFTLFEMMVAVGIFSMVVSLASGSALLFHRVHRKALNSQNVLDNVRFAMDSMAREIRTGDNFCRSTLPNGCVEAGTEQAPADLDPGSFTADCAWEDGGCSQFAFREALAINPSTIAYRLQNNAIQKRVGTNSWQNITDPLRTVSRLRFMVSGIGDPSEQQRVTIIIEVNASYLSKPGEESNLLLQTTVAKRKLTF